MQLEEKDCQQIELKVHIHITSNKIGQYRRKYKNIKHKKTVREMVTYIGRLT